jgi:hypothetical protein
MEKNSATQLKTQRKEVAEMATDLRGDVGGGGGRSSSFAGGRVSRPRLFLSVRNPDRSAAE